MTCHHGHLYSGSDVSGLGLSGNLVYLVHLFGNRSLCIRNYRNDTELSETGLSVSDLATWEPFACSLYIHSSRSISVGLMATKVFASIPEFQFQ